MDNLADNPEYSPMLEAMHTQLKADMKTLNDAFSTVDPKDLKRAKKAQAEQVEKVEKTEKPERVEPMALTEKQKKKGNEESRETEGQRKINR